MAYLGRTKETVMYFGANQETQELAKILRSEMTLIFVVTRCGWSLKWMALFINIKKEKRKIKTEPPNWIGLGSVYCVLQIMI